MNSRIYLGRIDPMATGGRTSLGFFQPFFCFSYQKYSAAHRITRFTLLRRLLGNYLFFSLVFFLPYVGSLDDYRSCVFWKASAISFWNDVTSVAAFCISEAGWRKTLSLLLTKEYQQSIGHCFNSLRCKLKQKKVGVFLFFFFSKCVFFWKRKNSDSWHLLERNGKERFMYCVTISTISGRKVCKPSWILCFSRLLC